MAAPAAKGDMAVSSSETAASGGGGGSRGRQFQAGSLVNTSMMGFGFIMRSLR